MQGHNREKRYIVRKAIAGCLFSTSVLFLAGLTLISLSSTVRAQSIVQSPTTYDVNQPFQMRTASRPHKGNDFLVPTGTELTTPGPVNCYSDPNGWGTYATVQLGCGVKTLYAHLTSCVSGQTSVISGGAAGAIGAGNSEGAHLHYELTSNNCTVDPQQAFGKDLCLGAVKDQLYTDAQNKLGQFGTCSAARGSDQLNSEPPPFDPNAGEASVISVGTGQINPATGVINIGPPYIYVIQKDGRVRVDLVTSNEENTIPILPPTVDDVVERGDASTDPVTSCAADTWAEMVNLAVLQVRREMIVNENYVSKPDSILAYSCFYDHMLEAGGKLGLLSESQEWVNRQVDVQGEVLTINRELSTTSLDGAINMAVFSAYERFLASNFSHGMLGGALQNSSSTLTDGDGANLQAYLPCGTMGQVWAMSRSQNAGPEKIFFEFEELIEPESDLRIFPTGTSCLNTGITANMFNIAKGANTAFSPIVRASALAIPEINPDEDNTDLDENACGEPFYSGVTVYRREGAGILTNMVENPDAICMNGCSYKAGACVMATP